jgi:hypothetical protein
MLADLGHLADTHAVCTDSVSKPRESPNSNVIQYANCTSLLEVKYNWWRENIKFLIIRCEIGN